jgi:hypothetical protein
VSITRELFAMRHETAGVADGNGVDGCPGDGGDGFRCDATVDDGPMAAIHPDVIDDGGMIEYLCEFGPGDQNPARMRIAEISRGHE